MGDVQLAGTLIMRLHDRAGCRQIEVEQAPPLVGISPEVLLDVEYGCAPVVNFDGDVLTINACNGVFRYRVDRRPVCWSFPTAEGDPGLHEFRMQRIDEAA